MYMYTLFVPIVGNMYEFGNMFVFDNMFRSKVPHKVRRAFAPRPAGGVSSLPK